MSDLEYPATVALLALLEYLAFVLLVGDARRRSGIAAPATSGDPRLERALRVQLNTLEQLMLFLPALFLFAWFQGPRIGALIGLGFVLGRALYAASYLRDPRTRGPGFALGFLATVVLLFGALVGALGRLLP